MYEKMFTELKIGNLAIKNRIVDEPHQVGLNIAGEEGGIVSPETMAFYRRRAQGGVGIIVTELACVETLTGCQSGKSILADKDYSVGEFAKLASAIHEGGAKGFVQINGFNVGRYWAIGPQDTLYIPGALLHEQNTIEVFELYGGEAYPTPAFCPEIKLDSLTENVECLMEEE